MVAKDETISLREYFERIFEERDRQYIQRMNDADRAVVAALASAEKAREKSEEAQHAVNERQNEFRAQLADQAATLMPRQETQALFAAVNQRIDTNQRIYEERHEALRKTVESGDAALDDDIQELRQFRSATASASITTREYLSFAVAGAGILVAALTLVLHVAGVF